MRATLLLIASLFALAAPEVALAHPTDQAAQPSSGAASVPATGLSSARGDLLLWGQGDARGYHLYYSRGEEGWGWRALATIQPRSREADSWIGYQCLTGDGRYAVVVVAPRHSANSPAARDRGGLAYVVSLPSGRVRSLARNVAVKYHNPGCGRTDRVVLSRNPGRDQAATELVVADASRAKLIGHARVAEQVTSAVPVGRRIWASSARGVVDVTTGEPRLLHRTDGLAFALRPAGRGVDLLVADGKSARLERVTGWHRSRAFGHGKLSKVALYGGRDGRNVAVGITSWRHRPAGLRLLASPRGAVSQAASLDGRVGLAFPTRTRDNTATRQGVDGAPTLEAQGGTSLEPMLVNQTGVRLARPALGEPVGKAYTALPSAEVPAFVARRADAVTPKCAVPRNDVRRQVPQPNAKQVNWAIQQATRNLLTGTVLTRPAGWANLGLVAYSPSSDFQRKPLTGNATAPVPPQVISAVYAQESAWHQASFRALAGVSGNPLVGDYYGAGGTLDRIEYNDADCGYGISQVTDAMTTSSPLYSANGKTKVAVDYAENVAAGIQVLVDKWNQLAAAGVKMNNGDPQFLENWYFAIWAYNSGFYANTGTGPWGLGWTNNPRNADYPPNRTPFLRATYADAEHPGSWPYQERIFGWMEVPMQDYKGVRAYTSGGTLDPPGINTFCSMQPTVGNECNQNYVNGSLSYCTRTDRKCWWHSSVSLKPCPDGCHVGTFDVSTTATEPAADNNYPPACSSTLPPSAVIVDEQSPNLNVEGCGASNWVSAGTFTKSYGANSAGVQLGQIDWHQLGTGFGGHTWFTKNRAAADTAHINTGTWTPPPLNGIYTVLAHVPASGASTAYARYTIHRGDGTTSVREINQHLHENRWVALGSYTLQAGAKVVLTNATPEPAGTSNVAYDAMAFYKVTGTPVARTFDATTTFATNTNLDTATWASGWMTGPLDSTKNAYDWAMKYTQTPATLATCTGAVTSSCVGSATKAAAAAWRYRVTASGDHWVSSPADTMAGWMGYDSPAPPTTLNASFLSAKLNYKIRGRLAVDFRHDGSVIDLTSVTVQSQTLTGDTHLPPWLLPVMRGIRDDYGVAMPNLTYTAPDLNEWTHAARTIDPTISGDAPGRAYRPLVSQPVLTDGGSCVRVKLQTGGAIGLKPLVKSAAVRGATLDWANRVKAQVTAGRAPAAVGDLAWEIYDKIFSPGSVVPPDANSPFNFAPPIWLLQDAKFCVDGSVRPGVAGGQIADSGYMPDLYLWVQNNRVNLQGAATTGPAQRGDFSSFAHVPSNYVNALFATSPWNKCNTVSSRAPFVNRRDGNPWTLEFDTQNDQTADQVRFCDEPTNSQPTHDLDPTR